MEIIGNNPGRPRERTARTPCWLSGHKKGGAVCSSLFPETASSAAESLFYLHILFLPYGNLDPVQKGCLVTADFTDIISVHQIASVNSRKGGRYSLSALCGPEMRIPP